MLKSLPMTAERSQTPTAEAVAEYVGTFAEMHGQEVDFDIVLYKLGFVGPEGDRAVAQRIAPIIQSSGINALVLPNPDGNFMVVSNRIVPVLRNVVQNAEKIRVELGMETEYSNLVFTTLQEALSSFEPSRPVQNPQG